MDFPIFARIFEKKPVFSPILGKAMLRRENAFSGWEAMIFLPDLFIAEFVLCPAVRIAFDIIPDLLIIPFSPDHMIVETLLPNRNADSF